MCVCVKEDSFKIINTHVHVYENPKSYRMLASRSRPGVRLLTERLVKFLCGLIGPGISWTDN